MLNICTFEFKEIIGDCVLFELPEKNIFARIFVLEENIFRVLFTKSMEPVLAWYVGI